MVYEDKIFNGINDKRLTRLVRPWPEGHAYLCQCTLKQLLLFFGRLFVICNACQELNTLYFYFILKVNNDFLFWEFTPVNSNRETLHK